MSVFYRHFLYPAWHWAKRDGVNNAIRELLRNQWLTQVELAALQQRKLSGLLSFAKKNVPYYRSLLNDLDIRWEQQVSPNDFQRIPLLTKAIIRHEHDKLISEDLTGNGLLLNSTSGSTGEAMRFCTDLRSTAFRKAAGIRSDFWTGWRLGEHYASLWGAPIDEKRAKGLRGRLHGLVTGRQLFSSFDLSASRMDEYLKTMRAFKPTLLLSYPGPLEQLALHCRERGVRLPSLKGIVSSAETLQTHQRVIAEDAFGVKVFDRYGSREFGQMGSECQAHSGLHVSVDRLLVEVVNDDGWPCRPGQTGRILVTDLDNFGMPLIRYDINDRAAFAKEQTCSCGRGLPLLNKIDGRTMEVVRTADGRLVGGTFWTLLLRSRPGIQQFQVIQKDLSGVVIKFIPGTEFDANVLDYFAARIREYCGQQFNVRFAQTATIDLTASGKQQLVISRLARTPENKHIEER